MRRTGFTLIELLVVIAIIAILAAILFPVFMSAKAKAHASACLLGRRQIGMALMQYAEDNNDVYPRSRYLGDDYWFRYLPTALDPYIKNWNVWNCPAIERKITDGSETDPLNKLLASKFLPTSVAMNANLMPPWPQVAIAMGHVRYPSRTLALYDWDAENLLQGICHRWDDYEWANPLYASIHFDGITIVFADGRAKWHKRQAVTKKMFSINH